AATRRATTSGRASRTMRKPPCPRPPGRLQSTERPQQTIGRPGQPEVSVVPSHAACRSNPNSTLADLLGAWPEEPERFEALSRAIADWPGLLAQVQRHGVLPVLAQAWLDHGLCPAAARPLVEEGRALARVWMQRNLESLDEVLGRLAQSGIAAVALKGPVLAERFHGDPLARFSLDIDLLVRPDDFQRAATDLEALGYHTSQG